MTQYWLSISSKFEALQKRERWMVACALFFVVYAIINAILLSPVLSHHKTLTNELDADKLQILELNHQINNYSHQNVVDPDEKNKKRIEDLHSHLQQLGTQLNSLQTTLINPEKMPELLRSLLKKNSKLKLIELKTLPTKGLLDIESADINAPVPATALPIPDDSQSHTNPLIKADSPVFKHGVEITLEGPYLDLLEYVAELEKMPWHILWSKAFLNGEHYPSSQLKLTVYTLSLDQTWLSI